MALKIKRNQFFIIISIIIIIVSLAQGINFSTMAVEFFPQQKEEVSTKSFLIQSVSDLEFIKASENCQFVIPGYAAIRCVHESETKEITLGEGELPISEFKLSPDFGTQCGGNIFNINLCKGEGQRLDFRNWAGRANVKYMLEPIVHPDERGNVYIAIEDIQHNIRLFWTDDPTFATILYPEYYPLYHQTRDVEYLGQGFVRGTNEISQTNTLAIYIFKRSWWGSPKPVERPFTISFKADETYLEFEAPGIPRGRIDGSNNCQLQSISQLLPNDRRCEGEDCLGKLVTDNARELAETFEETPTNIPNLESPTSDFASPNNVEDFKVEESLQIGEIRTYLYAWLPAVPVPTTPGPDGQPVICNQADRVVLGYERLNGLEGCYLAPIDVVKDFSDASKYPAFSCSRDICLSQFGAVGLTDYDAENFECVKPGDGTQQLCDGDGWGICPNTANADRCIIDASASGDKARRIQGGCIEDADAFPHDGFCGTVKEDTWETCCPHTSHPTDPTLKCNEDGSEWEEVVVPRVECPPNLCCVGDAVYKPSGTAQDEYGCPSSELCCFSRATDTTGICDTECGEPEPVPVPFLDSLAEMVQKLLGTGTETAKFLAIVFLIIAGILILVFLSRLLRPTFGTGLIGGPGLGGLGGGGSGGGQNVVVVK